MPRMHRHLFAVLTIASALLAQQALAKGAKAELTFSRPVELTDAGTTEDILKQSDNFKDGTLTVGDYAFVFDAYGHVVLKQPHRGIVCRWFGIFCPRLTVGDITVTQEQAKRRVTGQVIPSIHAEMLKDTGKILPMLAFALPEPLPRGTVIPHFFAKNPPLNVLSDSWFFFLDLEPYAEFGHRTEYVLVDAVTGEVTRRRAFSPPMLDGQPWLLSEEARFSSPDRFYPDSIRDLPPPAVWPLRFNSTTVPLRKQVPPKDSRDGAFAPGNPAFASVSVPTLQGLLLPVAEAQSAPGGVDPCAGQPRRKVAIVINGEPRARSQHFEQSAGAAMGMYRRLGVAPGDMHYMNPATHPKPEDVIKEIERIGTTLGPCDKLFFYITGHGTLVDEDNDDIPDAPSDGIVYGDGELGKGRYGDSFMDALEKVTAGIVNITVQSCFAGSLPTVIDQQAIRPHAGTVWHIFPSSDAVSSSYANPDHYRASLYTENLTYCVSVKLAERGITNPTIEQIESVTRECHEQLVSNPETNMAPISAQDVAPETITVSPDVSMQEGDSGVRYAEFTITRSPATRALSVDYSTYDPNPDDDPSNYANPQDYAWNRQGDRIDFAPGETTKTIRVAVYGDREPEGNETFAVWFGGLRTGRHVTIVDDDTPTTPSSPPAAALSPPTTTVVLTGPFEMNPVTEVEDFGEWVEDRMKDQKKTGGGAGLTITIDVGDWSTGTIGGYGDPPGVETPVEIETTCPLCDELTKKIELQAESCRQLETAVGDSAATLEDLRRQLPSREKDLKAAQDALDNFNNPKSYAESGGRRVTSSDLAAERRWARDTWREYHEGDISAEELEATWSRGMTDEERESVKNDLRKQLEEAVEGTRNGLEGLKSSIGEAEAALEQLKEKLKECMEALDALAAELRECEKKCAPVKEDIGIIGDIGGTVGSTASKTSTEAASSKRSAVAISSSKSEAKRSSAPAVKPASSSAKSVSQCAYPSLDLKTCKQSCEDAGKGECIGVSGTSACYTCREISAAPRCPSGTSADIGACEDVCGPKGGTCKEESNGCFRCLVAQCPSGTYTNECPSDCSSGCDLVGQDGSTKCYKCAQSCAEICAKHDYAQVGTNWNAYIQSQLNPHTCVSGATVSTESATVGSCSCSNQPTVTIDQSPLVCRGTACGDIVCGSSASCLQGDATVTINCKWGGWENIGENRFQPVLSQ